ncbi:MAG: hydroxymethylglutaryl-CoA reductase, degradative [Candidatus Marsarchaeota archaeon]
MVRSSDISGFYKLSQEDRIKLVAEFMGVNRESLPLPNPPPPLPLENSIGFFPINFAVANYFLIDGKDYLIPMATEEPSVVAAASNGAKMARSGGGFFTGAGEQLMLSEVVIKGAKNDFNPEDYYRELKSLADSQMPSVVAAGGGLKEVKTERLGNYLVVKFWVDTADSMGANALDRLAEAVAPIIETATGGKALLRVLSNRVERRLAWAEAKVPLEALGGEEVARSVEEASQFASLSEERAVTHNKGIMNGVSAVALATGNDTRALEAAAHSYACREGKYRPLSSWHVEGDRLVGRIDLPIPVGTVGGGVRSNEAAVFSLKLLGVSKAVELGRVMAAVGLAQNLAALKALVTEGIQKGHMRLAARTIAVTAGAVGDQVDRVADEMIAMGVVRVDVAKEILGRLNK